MPAGVVRQDSFIDRERVKEAIVLSWSGGKDSSLALDALRRGERFDDGSSRPSRFRR